jgi:hypothetical protein
MMTSSQKETIGKSKSSRERTQDFSTSLGMIDLKTKLVENLERAADFCKFQCDRSNFTRHHKNFISPISIECIHSCMKKHNISFKKAYNVIEGVIVDIHQFEC